MKCSRLQRLALLGLSLGTLWAIVGCLAIIPVTGNHTYWRYFSAYPADFGLTAEDVSFPSPDGIPLKAWNIRAPGESRGTVVVVHGSNGNRSEMLSRAAFLVRRHYDALLIDLRDHGESGGNYASPGFIMGHSYGAVAALYAAAQSPQLATVIADGALISFESMVHRATKWLVKQPLIFASLRPTAYELMEQPQWRSARTYNIMVGHLLGGRLRFSGAVPHAGVERAERAVYWHRVSGKTVCCDRR